MNTEPQAKEPFLLPMWTAELAMLLFSTLAIVGIMGWLPMQTGHVAQPVSIKPIPGPAKESPPPTAWTGVRGELPASAGAPARG